MTATPPRRSSLAIMDKRATAAPRGWSPDRHGVFAELDAHNWSYHVNERSKYCHDRSLTTLRSSLTSLAAALPAAYRLAWMLGRFFCNCDLWVSKRVPSPIQLSTPIPLLLDSRLRSTKKFWPFSPSSQGVFDCQRSKNREPGFCGSAVIEGHVVAKTIASKEKTVDHEAARSTARSTLARRWARSSRK
jgi:hypothetical protein